jgi:hypothetical protein
MEQQITGPWIKASASQPNDYDCVELAALEGGGVAVRSSRHPEAGILRYTRSEWAAFLDGAKKGEFDDFTQ